MLRHSRLARLCLYTVCPQGSECRVVQDCQICSPKPKCVGRDFIPAIADRGCHFSGFQQAVLLQSLHAGYPLRPRLCSHVSPSRNAKRTRCPLGAACVARYGGRNLCCFKQRTPIVEKPGFCPAVPGPGTCGGIFCHADIDCGGEMKCCRNACGGNVCTSVSASSVCGRCPPGTVCQTQEVQCIRAPCPVTYDCVPLRHSNHEPCPEISPSFCSSSQQNDLCLSDMHCRPSQSCCFDGCARRCRFTLRLP
ncbi:hypothetical protein PoB_007696300 [Plakobranchus ocellatus]|uniref:WAP domain-containing protein n=1 Tax=Plakobranchus ocellatus TaxID=259542 RepID=A0AAV4E1G0_9GAST|nr:hypothetical protein PoB_007696300 [Plakobranchus ocellatus]